MMLFDYSAVSLTLYSYYISHHPLDETQIKAQPSIYSGSNVMLFTSSCCVLILESSKGRQMFSVMQRALDSLK